MGLLEISANAFIALSIFLAGRNNINTWWIGIIGCVLFGALFYSAQLYADMTLQGFFIITGFIGWYQWRGGQSRDSLPITRTHPQTLMVSIIAGILVGVSYAYFLSTLTDAYAPGWDTGILVGSVIAQILLMNRKIENWGFWLIVNTIAVPLFISRGLYLTSLLYAAYWLHALYALSVWRNKMRHQTT